MSATKALPATHHLSFEGAVDADGHVLEPPELATAFADEGDRPAFLGDNARALFDIGA